jgi:hypothetical protein
MLRRLGLALILLGIGPACAWAGADDLNSAFVATLGQPAPVMRHVADKTAGPQDLNSDITLSLAPQFLVSACRQNAPEAQFQALRGRGCVGQRACHWPQDA